MKTKERIKIEQHLLNEFAQKVGFYNKDSSLFIYVGVESELHKELSLLHLDNMLKYLVGKEKETEKIVKEVIDVSLTNYYFEQLGDEIRSLRGELKSGQFHKRHSNAKLKMNELLDAYNLHSNQKLTLQEVVPAELLELL